MASCAHLFPSKVGECRIYSIDRRQVERTVQAAFSSDQLYFWMQRYRKFRCRRSTEGPFRRREVVSIGARCAGFHPSQGPPDNGLAYFARRRIHRRRAAPSTQSVSRSVTNGPRVITYNDVRTVGNRKNRYLTLKNRTFLTFCRLLTFTNPDASFASTSAQGS